MKDKIIKEDVLNSHTSVDVLSQPVTAENIKQLSKAVVSEMVKVLTSKDGYAVMKELSKR